MQFMVDTQVGDSLVQGHLMDFSKCVGSGLLIVVLDPVAVRLYSCLPVNVTLELLSVFDQNPVPTEPKIPFSRLGP